MKTALVAIGLTLAALVVAGVIVVNSLGPSDILGGSSDCACGDAGPSWSPDGKLIVYAHNDSGKDAHLYTISPTGGKPRRLTEQGSDESPVWSPDGSTIAFVHSEGDPSAISGPGAYSYIEVLDAGGGDTRRLAQNDGTGLFAWSPDGRTAAYKDEDDRLRSVASDGGSRRIIELGRSDGVPETADSFDWAPGGRMLVYSSRGQIYFAAANGSVRWKDFRSRAVDSVDWSPDGSRLAFKTEQGVYAMDVDGRRLKRLSRSPFSDPVWSREGTRLAWVENGTIVISDPDGGKRLELAPTGAYPSSSPEWSPDGKQLVISAEPAGGTHGEGETKLFIIPVAHPERTRQLT
jgi:Tol biopolymer transport system component